MLPIQFIKHKEEGRTGSRLLDLTYNVCHASLVAKEGSEVAGLLRVIPREGFHCRKRELAHQTHIIMPIVNRTAQKQQVNKYIRERTIHPFGTTDKYLNFTTAYFHIQCLQQTMT